MRYLRGLHRVQSLQFGKYNTMPANLHTLIMILTWKQQSYYHPFCEIDYSNAASIKAESYSNSSG